MTLERSLGLQLTLLTNRLTIQPSSQESHFNPILRYIYLFPNLNLVSTSKQSDPQVSLGFYSQRNISYLVDITILIWPPWNKTTNYRTSPGVQPTEHVYK